jgi:hypothetical protein
VKDLRKFIIVKKNNRVKIGKKLRRLEGVILIAEPGSQSYQENVRDIEISLFDRPKFHRGSLSVYRGSEKINGEDWQTGYENDRAYRLSPIPPSSNDPTWQLARELFDRMGVNRHYSFKIDFQSVVGRGIEAKEPGLTIYVPRDPEKANLRAAFHHSLKYLVEKLNRSIVKASQKDVKSSIVSDADIDRIVGYVMEDLRTGSVLKKNIAAGREADMVTGLA